MIPIMASRKIINKELAEFRNQLLIDPQSVLDSIPDRRVLKAYYVAKALSVREQIGNLPKIKESCFFFATNFIRTFDEEAKRVRVYPDFPYLKNIVLPAIFEDGNHLWEKSQRSLITISFCAAYLWAWLTWETGFMGWMTSRMDDSVYDSGPTWKSLFGKMRFMYDRIYRENPWLLEHFLGQALPADKVFSKNHLHNPKNGNLVIGEAPKVGTPTGEGYVIALVDECALVPQMNSIHGNLMMACRNCHYVSYPWGMNNTFAEIRHAPGSFGFKIVTIDYDMNPEHGQEWFARLAGTMQESDVARRLKRSYRLTTVGTVFKNFSRDKSIVNDVKFDWSSVQLWLDFGFVDATAVAIVYVTRIEISGAFYPAVIVIDDLKVDHQNYSEIAKTLRTNLRGMGYGGKMKAIKGFGDPQVKQTLIDSGSTMQQRYRDVFAEESTKAEVDKGLHDGFVIEPAKQHDTRSTLEEIDSWLGKGRFIVSAKAVHCIDSLEKWTWPTDSRGNLESAATQPAHNNYSHMGKAIEYGMVQFFVKQENKEPAMLIQRRTMADVMGGIQ